MEDAAPARVDLDEVPAGVRPSPSTESRNVARVVWERARAWHAVVRRAIDRVDPNDDPDADQLSIPFVLSFTAALAWSSWMVLRWKYQPMQDFGHHAALAAVVADWGRPGSLYTSLYQPIDPFAANSLMYQVAGRIGRLVGVTNALRGCLAFYVAGTPIALLWALRVFGRSGWPAILAVPLVYNMIYVAGFGNMLFAAPFMIAALVLYYRLLDHPSRRRALASAIVFALLFLAHAHLFMWTGALCFVMALVALVVVPSREPTTVDALKSMRRIVLWSVAAVSLSLLSFAHWYSRTFGAHRTEGGVQNATSTWSDHFGAYFRSTHDLFSSFDYSFQLHPGDKDLDQIVWLFLIVGVAFALSRMHRFAKPPVLELAFVLTGVSYFFLPDGIKGHDVIAQRQLPIALWFLPALASPVPMQVSRAARMVVVTALLVMTWTLLSTWNHSLLAFERDEIAGLNVVMKAAPPRMRLHYVKLDPDSKYFEWHSFWHLDKLYMTDKLGQVADNPAILSTSPIRYRDGVDVHRLGGHSDQWFREREIWENFDLILIRRWHPTDAMLAEAKKHGERLAKSGDWELWKSNEAKPFDFTIPPEPKH